MSRTVIVLLHVDELPQASVARHVRVHTVGQVPEEVVLTTVGVKVPLQPSLAVGVAHERGAGQSIVVAAGHVMLGAVMSRTVMVLLQVAVLPQSSVAFQVRVHTVGQVPADTVLTTVMSTVASQASLAVAVPQDGLDGQSMVVASGQEMTGGVLSITVTDWLQVDALPQASVAVQVRVRV
jgi:hypothetical protein